MKSTHLSRISVAALVAVIALSTLPLLGCEGEPTPAGNAAAPANRAATNTTAPTTTNAAGPMTNPPAPLGMEDTIEGRVIGLICYRENPGASPEEAKACAAANVERGGALGVLAADGTLYVDDNPDARVTNGKLKFFVGEEVTIQGQLIGDAPELGWSGVTVKKFRFRLPRRKGSVPPGTPRQMESTGPKKAEAPAKKP